jgi:predicted nuclease of predicted toxin-antitoxin system
VIEPVRLYLDEDVDPHSAQDLRLRGYDALAASEAGQLGRADREQLDYARQQGRALLTHNRNDFLALAKEYVLQGIPHAGILYIPQLPYRELFRRLLRFLAIATRAQVENVFIWIP